MPYKRHNPTASTSGVAMAKGSWNWIDRNDWETKSIACHWKMSLILWKDWESLVRQLPSVCKLALLTQTTNCRTICVRIEMDLNSVQLWHVSFVIQLWYWKICRSNESLVHSINGRQSWIVLTKAYLKKRKCPSVITSKNCECDCSKQSSVLSSVFASDFFSDGRWATAGSAKAFN